MYKTTLILLILVFSFVTSCRSSRQVVQKNDRESELIKERVVTYRDTTFYTPSSESRLTLPASVLNYNSDLNDSLFVPKIYYQKNGNATLHLRVERDALYATATCDSLALRAQIKQEFQSEYNHLKESNITDEKRTKGVPVFKTILFIMLAFIVGFGAAYLLKTFKII